MKKNFLKIAAFTIIISIIFTYQTGFAENTATQPTQTAAAAAPTIAPGGSLEYLQRVMNMIKEQYNGQISDQALIDGALKGMFSTMDPYTTFFSNEEANAFTNSLSGSFDGIGIQIETHGDYTVILKVFPGTPAETSGLLPGDTIVKIDGESIQGMASDQVSTKIRGTSGTTVKIEVLRGTDNEQIIKDIIRAQITISPVTYNIVN